MTRPLILLAALCALAACDRRPEAPPGDSTPTAAPARAPAGQADLVAHMAARTELTTFAAALQSAGLLDTLRSPGPWTVFAPDNAAFDRIPIAERESLLQPERQVELRRRLGFHIVPGRLTLGEIARRAQAAGGKLTLTTFEGGQIVLQDAGAGRWAITDANGGRAIITEGDEAAGNGVLHRLDTSLTPG